MTKVCLAISVLFFSACSVINCTEGSGEMISKTFPQNSFDSFDLSSSADVELIPSNKNEIEVYTYPNIMEKLAVENKGGEVSIDLQGCIRMNKGMKVKVFFTKLNKVKLSGSGNIVSNGKIIGDSFAVEILGSGDANVDVEVSSLSAEIMGSGDIMLRGKTANLKGEINGSGNIKAAGLQSSASNISINGSGDATLGSCANMTSSVNGSGNVNCIGK